MSIVKEILDIDYKVKYRKVLEPVHVNDWELGFIGVLLGKDVVNVKATSESTSLLPCILNLPIPMYEKIELIGELIGDVTIRLSLWLEVKSVDEVKRYLQGMNFTFLGEMNYMGKKWLTFVRQWDGHFVDVAVTQGFGVAIPKKAIQHLSDIFTKPWKWIEIEANWLEAKVKVCTTVKYLEDVKDRARKAGYLISYVQEETIEKGGKCWNVNDAAKLFDLLQERREVIGIAHSNTYFVYVLSKDKERTEKYIREKIKVEKGFTVIQV